MASPYEGWFRVGALISILLVIYAYFSYRARRQKERELEERLRKLEDKSEK